MSEKRISHEVRDLRFSVFMLASVALCTLVSFRLGQGFAFTGFVYLVFVVLAAMYGGFWQATVVSVVAAACLNYLGRAWRV
jgi:K+-sensing histidine kinase KdpD